MKSLRYLLCSALAALLLVGCSSPAPESPVPAQSEPSVSEPAQQEVPQSEQSPAPELPSPSDTSTPETPDQTESPAAQDNVEWDWFDDAVFIGDSVSLKLKNYVTKQRQSDPNFMGGAQFLTSGSLGSANALWEVSEKSVHPNFQGEKMLLEESVPLTGAKKIYIMLGTNDIAVYGIDSSVENMSALLDRILAATPDAAVYVQSATPICEGAEKKQLNNDNLEIYNEKLAQLCQEKGYTFVNVASVLRDENGFLPREYCSDPDGMGIHFTDVACELWIDYLRSDAAI